MSILSYVANVQAKLRSIRPDLPVNDPEFQEWFADTGRIACAMSDAACGVSGSGLRVAEEIAERYHIH